MTGPMIRTYQLPQRRADALRVEPWSMVLIFHIVLGIIDHKQPQPVSSLEVKSAMTVYGTHAEPSPWGQYSSLQDSL